MNLNMTPTTFDSWRVRYSPEHIFDCGHCYEPLEPFTTAMVLPGNFHHPNMSSLLCERCTKLFWEEEDRKEKIQQEADW